MKSISNLVSIRTIEIKDTTPAKPQFCYLFDGLTGGETSKVLSFKDEKESNADTLLSPEQKASLVRGFIQREVVDVLFTKLTAVIVKDDITAVELEEVLKRYWLIADYTKTDFSTKFAQFDTEKRIFKLIKDVGSFTEKDAEYPTAPKARYVEIWWNGDLDAHGSSAVNYIYRNPETGSARPVKLVVDKAEFLSASVSNSMGGKAINDFSEYEEFIGAEDLFMEYHFANPVLKDGSNLVLDYNKKITTDAILSGMVALFRDKSLPYSDRTIPTINGKLLSVFITLSEQGIVDSTSDGMPLYEVEVISIEKTPAELKANKTFMIKGEYTVSSGVAQLDFNFSIAQN